MTTHGLRRWPGFTVAARQRGIRAVFAFPLQVGAMARLRGHAYTQGRSVSGVSKSSSPVNSGSTATRHDATRGDTRARPTSGRPDSIIAADRLAAVCVEVADTLVDDFDVVEFLESLTRHTATISDTASAGLLLADPHGHLQYMASSQESVKLLELFQLQYREGPCLDCFRTGTAVVNTDLHQAAHRWPLFAPRAVEAGFQSVHAFALRHRQKVIGAMNLFSADTGRLDPSDVRVIQSLADIATIGVLQERTIRNAEILTEQLQSALNSRITIEQAKGVLARTHGLSVDAAFELMRDYARRRQHRLSDVARAVVTEPGRHPELTASP